MADLEPMAKKIKHDSCIANPSQCTRTPNSELLKEANEALQESNRIHVRPIIDEAKLGIELFVGDRKDEFHGLIKSRYADFIVHEIDTDGNIAYLNTLHPPDEKEPTNCKSLSDFVDDKALESMSEVNEGYLYQYKIDVTGMDKDLRTSLHYAIRASFDRLESSTLSESEINAKKEADFDQDKRKDSEPDLTQQVDGSAEAKTVAEKQLEVCEKKYIVVTRRNKISRPKNVWPRDRPDHTHFILYKENKDTMDAVHNLAAAINTKPSNFSFAGVKDRRAVTTQWLSSWRLEPKRLISASRRFNKRPYIKVGNFCFKKEPLRLGNLKANKFDIVIRHLVHNNEGVKTIEKSMDSIKERGFVNYFGLQRFGTRSIQTHEIGLAVLQGNWRKAVDLILSYRFDDNMQPPQTQDKNSENICYDNETTYPSSDCPRVDRQKTEVKRWASDAEQHNSFIDLWKSKLDAEVVFKKYSHYRFTNEGIIMKFLSKSEESSQNYLGAVVSLPRTTRSMYIHSYQSLLWNKVTTYRLKKYGFKVVVGDLVLSSDANITDNSLEILLSADETDHGDDPHATKNTDGDSHINNNRKVPIEDIDNKVVIATEENIERFTILDVIIPLLGSRIRLPENDVGDEFRRLLEADNITMDSFKACEKLFISYGSYRKIMVKPENVNWCIKQYSHPQQNLIETDLERLNRENISKDTENDVTPVSPPKSDSNDEALIVEFELPPSSYATMCLREIMKKPSTEINNKF